SGLLTLDMLEEVAFPAATLAEVRETWPGLDPVRTGHELVRRQITRMVEDVIATSIEGLRRLSPQSPEEVRGAGETIVRFSATMAALERELKAFLFERLYRHPTVLAVREQADRIVRELFDAYMADIGAMPENWRMPVLHADEAARARQVCDFLAGMTDTYALREYRRLFDRDPQLR